METIEPKCCSPPLNHDLIRLLGSRGTMEILFIFCCSDESHRFTHLQKMLTHISSKTLSTRLRQLVEKGILERTVHNEIPPRVEYSITGKGQSLVEALTPLLQWMNENQVETC